ncbi:Uncharacterised protein [Burkholderia pseudomallei]|nr:Uncharacterised protein [Burkholderia pseudomallei]
MRVSLRKSCESTSRRHYLWAARWGQEVVVSY